MIRQLYFKSKKESKTNIVKDDDKSCAWNEYRWDIKRLSTIACTKAIRRVDTRWAHVKKRMWTITSYTSIWAQFNISSCMGTIVLLINHGTRASSLTIAQKSHKHASCHSQDWFEHDVAFVLYIACGSTHLVSMLHSTHVRARTCTCTCTCSTQSYLDSSLYTCTTNWCYKRDITVAIFSRFGWIDGLIGSFRVFIGKAYRDIYIYIYVYISMEMTLTEHIPLLLKF